MRLTRGHLRALNVANGDASVSEVRRYRVHESVKRRRNCFARCFSNLAQKPAGRCRSGPLDARNMRERRNVRCGQGAADAHGVCCSVEDRVCKIKPATGSAADVVCRSPSREEQVVAWCVGLPWPSEMGDPHYWIFESL